MNCTSARETAGCLVTPEGKGQTSGSLEVVYRSLRELHSAPRIRSARLSGRAYVRLSSGVSYIAIVFELPLQANRCVPDSSRVVTRYRRLNTGLLRGSACARRI